MRGVSEIIPEDLSLMTKRKHHLQYCFVSHVFNNACYYYICSHIEYSSYQSSNNPRADDSK